MKNILNILIFVFTAVSSFGQTDKQDDKAPIYLAEVPPIWKGCEDLESADKKAKCSREKVIEFLKKNMNISQTTSISGILTFQIDKNGRVRNPRILRGIDSEIGDKVIKTILEMPDWIPAKNKGENVETDVTLPINIKFER